MKVYVVHLLFCLKFKISLTECLHIHDINDLERRFHMKGIWLIVVGNILFLASVLFGGSTRSDFSDFSSGVLIGLSLGCNLIGIILAAKEIKSNEKE